MSDIFEIASQESFDALFEELKNGAVLTHIKDNLYKIQDTTLEFNSEYMEKLRVHDIIYGINKEEHIVSVSVKDDKVFIFKEINGKISIETRPYYHFVLYSKKLNESLIPLEGRQRYKYIKEYNLEQFNDVRKHLFKTDSYTIWNPVENYITRNGLTYYKGVKIQDVSLLSFDIETTGLDPLKSDAQVLLITNTLRKQGQIQKVTFRADKYESEKVLIEAWADWVREVDPSILLGHNIIMFDIPYLNSRYKVLTGNELCLGRLDLPISINEKPSQFRKDGSQSYTFHKISCFGREIIDTFFLAIKTDIGRKYESYGLKAIIKHEGLEKQGRTHYNAANIKNDWADPVKREEIIKYGEDDADDPIKLFDLMVPPIFYMTQYIPKSFQSMIESASGAQLSGVMNRAYIQKNKSIPAASEAKEYEGAISFGIPGIYKNVFKIDFSALYPSIMRQYKVYDKNKDDDKVFLTVVETFAEFRQRYKSLYKETGDKHYDDMQNVAKVVANSCYGFLGASGINFNSPECAAFITAKARELLTFSIKWATNKDVEYWKQLFEEKTK